MRTRDRARPPAAEASPLEALEQLEMTTARRRAEPEPPSRGPRITPHRAVASLVATAAAALALAVLVAPTSGSEVGASSPTRAGRTAAAPAAHQAAPEVPDGSAGARPASLTTGRPRSTPATTPPATIAALGSTAERPPAATTAPTPAPDPAPPASTVPAPAPEPPPTVVPEDAGAAAGSVWDELAECESGGDWAIDTGNGYYGGLQFSASTWSALGGTGLPHEHPREVQVATAERLLDSQGWGAWPSCSSKLGLA